MKLSRKQIKLMSFFGFFYFFIPFVFVNCGGEDIPYIVKDDGESNPELDNCAENEFLTQACVDSIAEQGSAEEPTEPSPAPADQPEEEEIADPETQPDPPATGLSNFRLPRSFEPITERTINVDINRSEFPQR
jgi:hypothetical protein